MAAGNVTQEDPRVVIRGSSRLRRLRSYSMKSQHVVRLLPMPMAFSQP
jgi:hypothetical protein